MPSIYTYIGRYRKERLVDIQLIKYCTSRLRVQSNEKEMNLVHMAVIAETEGKLQNILKNSVLQPKNK